MMRRVGFVPLLGFTLACGPGATSIDDEVGETGTMSASSESETAETWPETTGSETSIEGDLPICMLEPGETLWSLSCDTCSRIDDDAGLISLSLEGSGVWGGCGHSHFEGTVMDHPSPDVWIFDACPCDEDCTQPDPRTLDLSGLDLHPVPELLPTDLGECVRVDYWQSASSDIFEGGSCVPQAVALWNLDGDVPVLSYAQGGSTGYAFPIDLGWLDIIAQEDCELHNANEGLHTWSYMFMLSTITFAGSTVTVPPQTSGLLMTSTGDYEARNIAAQSWGSANIDHGTQFYWWAVHRAL